ncbi:MAG: P-loop NTPase [SAR324 cluster bacterium]|nr:P-loop NTPase [SAR324 cluster bacterium]
MSIQRGPVIISVGSGKGGVGKTFILSNLAYLLAKGGLRVTLVDLDLGGSDLQIMFGLYKTRQSLSDFLSGQVSSLQALEIQLLDIPRLNLIPGISKTLATTQLSFVDRVRICQALTTLKSDVVLVDIGAGAHSDILDFYLEGQIQIIIGTPEPTSIFDLSRFVKMATVHYVSRFFIQNDLIHHDLQNMEFETVKNLLEYTGKLDPETRKLALQVMKAHRPYLIINQSSSQNIKLTEALKNFIRQINGKEDILGMIPQDNTVQDAIRRAKPMHMIYAGHPVTQALVTIAGKLQALIKISKTKTPSAEDFKLYQYQNVLTPDSETKSESLDDFLELATNPFETQSTESRQANPVIQTAETIITPSVSALRETPKMDNAATLVPPLEKIRKKMTIPTEAELPDLDLSRWKEPEGFKPVDIIGVLPTFIREGL